MMIKTIQADLENKVKDYASKVRDRVQQERRMHPNKKHSIFDYPGCVVACSYKNTKPVAKESGSSAVSYYTNRLLFDKLDNLRKDTKNPKVIGEKSYLCNNRIGCCAEPRAAELVLRNYNTKNFGDLYFSKAYRPRTSKRMNYCPNCKKVFSI